MILFNLIWFILFGWWQSILYLLVSVLFAITIVGIPIAKSLYQFAKLCAFPFGKEIIKETELKGDNNVSAIRKIGGTIVNLLWVPFGIFFAILYIISGIASFISIIGIPAGIVYCKAAKFIVFPIGAKVVSKKQAYASAVANELDRRNNNGNSYNAADNTVRTENITEINTNTTNEILNKPTPISYLYLCGMAVIAIGFCCPMITSLFHTTLIGFEFINFNTSIIVTLGAIIIFAGAIIGIAACFIPQLRSYKLAFVIAVFGGVIVLFLGFATTGGVYGSIIKHIFKSMAFGFYMIIIGIIVAIVGALQN